MIALTATAPPHVQREIMSHLCIDGEPEDEEHGPKGESEGGVAAAVGVGDVNGMQQRQGQGGVGEVNGLQQRQGQGHGQGGSNLNQCNSSNSPRSCNDSVSNSAHDKYDSKNGNSATDLSTVSTHTIPTHNSRSNNINTNFNQSTLITTTEKNSRKRRGNGLLAMPSRRDNLTYRARILKGGEDEKRRAIVDILKASQSGDGMMTENIRTYLLSLSCLFKLRRDGTVFLHP